MENFNVTLVQFAATWENPKANRDQLNLMLERIPNNGTDLILFPETFSTGFTNASKKWAEKMNGPTVEWLLASAKIKQAVIAGSLIIEEDEAVYNRLVFAYPDGQLEHYDKRHLFTLSKEHENFTAGKERKIIKIKGWKIFPQICYDLRFPVWSRNDLEYDLAIYVANWPSPRKEAWRALTVARAIENQAYVVAVNRVGTDANQLNYEGNSACIDYTGMRIMEFGPKEMVQTISLQKEPMNVFRKKLAFLKDQDRFELK